MNHFILFYLEFLFPCSLFNIATNVYILLPLCFVWKIMREGFSSFQSCTLFSIVLFQALASSFLYGSYLAISSCLGRQQQNVGKLGLIGIREGKIWLHHPKIQKVLIWSQLVWFCITKHNSFIHIPAVAKYCQLLCNWCI